MSLTLKEILTELATTVGRTHLLEHIEAIPFDGAEAEGETEAEKASKENPLSAEEEKQLAALQARVKQPEPVETEEGSE
jgi:hypothetical protein